MLNQCLACVEHLTQVVGMGILITKRRSITFGWYYNFFPGSRRWGMNKEWGM